MRSKKSHPAEKAIFAICLALLLVLAMTAQPAQAQTFKVLHTFKGASNDGAAPWGVLVRDRAGNFYGTTTSGGSGRGFCTNYGGCGTAFKFDKSGKEIWLHSFTFPKGWSPETGLLLDKSGNLYGTTYGGGDTSCDSIGCGTIFDLSATGKETVRYKFEGSPDGQFPTEQPLVEDSSGNLYGTTGLGGDYGIGSIFKIDKAGNETILYSFTGYSDGCYPDGVILDMSGNLYGVAFNGGIAFGNSGYGVVFELDASGKFSVLHTFDGGDGANPQSALIFDSEGNLYGTTQNGGSGECGGTGCGAVFELSPQSGGGWSESVLYAFCSLSGCTDGEKPLFGPLAMDTAGNIYGTTYFGDAYRNCDGDACGVVFKLDQTHHETVLHSFTGGKDGAFPITGVILDNAGNLYGTAVNGGDLNCQPKYGGCGTLFRIAP
jgi:uncharacterized repeat protein (TIGR03803 family)